MRVLVTGAFGNIGAETLRELLEAGHEVRGFDLDSRRSRQTAREFDGRIEIVWGDVTRADDVAKAVEGRDAVIHDAALLPPASERNEELTQRVNVDGTRNVIAACKSQSQPARLVFASSFSLYGPSAGREPPVRADDPIVTTDAYTRSKAACEELLRESSLEWVIMRFAAAPPLASPTRDRDRRRARPSCPPVECPRQQSPDRGIAGRAAAEPHPEGTDLPAEK